jgi:WD40 repeat protein
MSTSLHWLDLSEYLAIAVAVVGSIAAVSSSAWVYAIAPILISLILNAINRWRFTKNMHLQDRSFERRIDQELQLQGEVLQQEIVQARSFATALVKQTMTVPTTSHPALAAVRESNLIEPKPETNGLEQKFDRQQQLMRSMQEHVAGVESSLQDVVNLLESNALADRVEYLERHLTQISGHLGIEPVTMDGDRADLDRLLNLMVETAAEPEIDITPLLEMISEDLMSSDIMSDNLVSAELSGDLWSKPTWDLQQTIAAHSDWVRCLSFTPMGDQLVSGSFDKTIKLWQLDTGTALYTLGDRLKGVFALAVSPDGQLLASGSRDETIELWNLSTGALLHNLSQHQGSVRSLAIAPDSQTLISGSFDQTIILWNLPDGTVRTTITDREPIAVIALSADGSFLVSTGDNGVIKIWSLATGLKIAECSENQHCIGSLVISPETKTIAAGTTDGYLVLWQIATDDYQLQLSLSQTIKAHAGQINACVFSPDSQYIITGSVDGKAKVWYKGADAKFHDKARSILKGDPGRSVMSVAIAPGGQLVAIGGADGTIQLWQRM